MTTREDNPKPLNRLAREKSPYLLQHQHNPVDWFPWGPEAFEKARRESKPIFLSIGYSTCHWCHVMERESFEHPAIARLLNDHFVSIKVDREERPDVDELYMDFVQAVTGRGGWPMSVFLTPERKPFFGGTYFPDEPRHGQPGFRQVLTEIQQAWERRPQEVLHSAAEVTRHLARLAETSASEPVQLSPSVLKPAAAQLKMSYDARYGGFGAAPKFPQPALLHFLLSYGVLYRDEEAVEMVLKTCDRMAAGGLHDQLGGGFSRYATDAEWLVPHFEKMLYDNAQLLLLYLQAFQVSGQESHAGVALSIARYVLRDLTHEHGGFFSAEDADSEGQEGRFYCWTEKEMAEVLPPEEFDLARRYFGVTPEGNFVDHSNPDPWPGLNVLHVHRPELSGPALESAKARLLAARNRRIRPHRDDKILVSWNGLMLSALAQASAILPEEEFLQAAERNLAFLREHLWDDSTHTLYHRWREGERDRVQLLKGYAFLLQGTLDLYQVTLDSEHLVFAMQLADAMLQRFYDSAKGGFWQTPADTKDLILRLKDRTDGAEPAGNSVAVRALTHLAEITGRSDYREAAQKTLYFYAEALQKQPLALPYLLQTAEHWFGEHRRVTLAGQPGSPGVKNLLLAVHAVYQPLKTVLGTEGPVDPDARKLDPGTSEPQAQVCVGTTCFAPTTDAAQLKTMLGLPTNIKT